MAHLPADALFEHLCALRDADDPTAAAHEPHWRGVDGWIRRAFPGTSSEIEDARQEVLIRVLRNVGRMRADVPAQAAGWVRMIMRRRRVDALRARAHDAVREGLREEGRRRSDATRLVEQLEADDARGLTPAMLETLVSTVLHHVHRALEATVPSAQKRQLRRTQAQAALLRLVCGWDADAIRSALDHGEPISNERLYKWVERGRGPVDEGLDRWLAEATDDPDVAGVVGVLRELVGERRADAGVPRPERRRDRPVEPT